MCCTKKYCQNPAAENASEDVYDLLIYEPDRAEIEAAFRIANTIFNNALEPAQNINRVRHAPSTYTAGLNFEDFFEGSEIQTIIIEEN